MKFNPYLSFDGRCREAFEFYEKTFAGKITFIQTIGESAMASGMPPETHGRVMHVTLQVGDQVLQGADAPGPFTQPAGFSVALHFDDAVDGQRVFDSLAENGMVQMPFQETFWAKGFGMLVDQFGTPWLVNAGQGAS
jgi:PhnB protein